MKRDLLLYQRALFLRKKKGYSYNEIRAELSVAKSTLSEWLRNVALSPEQKKRLVEKQRSCSWNLGEWNREKRQKEINIIRVAAKKEIGYLSEREFFISGLMLYWAEGGKGGKCLQICNADPALIKFIMHWFRSALHISEDRFTGSIHYHEGQNEDTIKQFWSELSGIPLAQFNKSFKKPPGTGHRKHYLQWGVFRIVIRRSSNLFHSVAGWKDGLIHERISGINSK
ncbi:MAG: hypothetical protein HYZ63_04150 [Candidatus Andersenbacteria bacterium]|nr:hypothetical protein [Candidatus Andersenbacteria bacterium]